MTAAVVVIGEAELRAIVGDEVARAVAPLAGKLAEVARASRPPEAKDDPIASGTLTAKQVSAALGVDRREVRRLVASGAFPPPLKVGRRRIRWRRADVTAYLERARGTP